MLGSLSKVRFSWVNISSNSLPESVVTLEPKDVCGEFRSPTITILLLIKKATPPLRLSILSFLIGIKLPKEKY